MTGIALKRIDRAKLSARAELPRADAAEQQYRWQIDHSPVAMCVHVDGRYVYVNQTLVRKMGAQSADQLLGRNDHRFHPPGFARRGARADRSAAARRRHDPALELAIRHA